MKRYKITIAYDGTSFSGWQTQENSTAIQPFIQKALETVLRHSTELTGSGRTDAGVHALGQTAHFDTQVPFEERRLLLSLNSLIPKEIRILKVESVPNHFHARYSALGKIYHYHLHLDAIRDPFARLYRHHVLGKFDLHLLQSAIPYIIGTHDFTSFTNQPHKGCASRNPIRTLSRLDCVEEPGGIRLEFEANGFLYKMVRNITGTLLNIAAGRIKPEDLPSIFAAKDRCKGGIAAPPHGLFLMKVLYPEYPSMIHNG